MARNIPTITAQSRDRYGSRYAKRLRDAGGLPAVIYGHRKDPVSVTLQAKPVLEALHHGAHVMSIQVEGGGVETCLVKDLQFGHLGDNVIHVDLARVDLEEEVTVGVAIHFVGQAEASKVPGSVMTHELSELKVRCRVKDIPEAIRVDLSHMEGELLTAAQVKLPEGTTLASDPHGAVARVVFVAEEVVAEAATPAAGAATEPEVLTARKEVPEGEAGAAGKPGAAGKSDAPAKEAKK